ncbi:hypothetical protein [Vibrio aestuarianus]|uniref:hypothetical protein n=1 Tax=Vibrio aestuarianus TaxID=28171 RepID=UPI00237CFFB3|nr:hypothetical protein [Vibrio aestuarianus]MDE1238773.1 hypothetical protein [Vibrio aestuarianus]
MWLLYSTAHLTQRQLSYFYTLFQSNYPAIRKFNSLCSDHHRLRHQVWSISYSTMGKLSARGKKQPVIKLTKENAPA